MNRIFLLLIAACSAVLAHAQTPGTTVTGRVLQGDKPVEKATITLHRPDSSTLYSVVSASTGHFSISPEKPGTYLLSITAVGLQTFWSAPVVVQPGAAVLELPLVKMEVAYKKLDEVVVLGNRPLLEQKIDRMVVNVDASPGNVGTTALEVLERTPGVTVDKDGNISLKGKSGVLVMIDGKPTYLSNADVANLLRSLPSSQLEQLEIMTNPPAKYDAAGNAGVINIKTKKNKARGFNGNFTVGGGIGHMGRSNNSLALNYRYNKVNLFANTSVNYNGNLQDMTINRKFTDAATGNLISLFDQQTDVKAHRYTGTIKMGMDYYASKKTTWGIVLTGLYNPSENNSKGTTWIKNPAGEVQTRMESVSTIETDWKNGGVNLNFRHIFDSSGKEISADVDYLGYKTTTDQLLSGYFFDKTGQPNAPDEIVKGDLPGVIDIYSAKVDYVHPLKKGMKLEAGAKSSFVETDNNALYALLKNGSWVRDEDRSNHFRYKENINALYINTSKQISKKWSGQLGLRLENTHARGHQVTTSERFSRQYTQLFPTAYLAYKASDKNQFSLSYGRRIQRPNYQDMNPFYFFLDKYTYQVGNPYLQPQFSHNIDLSHTFMGFLTTTLNYTNTKDIINQILEQDDASNTTYVKMGNIARQQQIGLSIAGGFPVTKWWTSTIYINGFFNEFKGPINGTEVELSAPGFLVNVQNIFKLKKGWGGEVSGFYRSKAQEGVFTARSMSQMTVAVSKQVMKGKGSIRLNILEIWDPLLLIFFLP
ncbi:MAG: TonB-dependent receptor, partial [Chitinophagaceae bacterium]|nr:TonB-dependent receptor [Chitinophagaceae bacterium]